MIDHAEYIRREIVGPIQNRLGYFFRVNEIDPEDRLEIELGDHDVTFYGMFQDDGNVSWRTIGPIKYDRIFITMHANVDGLPVVEDAPFEFTRSIQDPSMFSEAIDGSAFTLYRKLEPVISHGFCSSCDVPYFRDEDGGLLCKCIESASPRNPD